MGYEFDGTTKVITLTAGTTSFSVRDMTSRAYDWWLNEDAHDNAKWRWFFRTLGGDEIDPDVGSFVPVFAWLKEGWRILPQDADHTLTVEDGILLVDGGGDPFLDVTGRTVRIRYQQPIQVLTVATGAVTPEDVAEAVLAAGIEGAYSVTQVLRILLAVIGGKSSGFPTAPIFRDTGDTKARVTATLDAQGNRTAVTLDGT